MATLHLGVIDVPYKDGNGETTGDVADKLEYEYQVIEVFFETYEKEIDEVIEQAIANEIERIVMMGTPTIGFINTSKIDDLFRKYLDANEWQQRTGRTIHAAIMGYSKRFKDRYNLKRKRGPRPAFIDTGQYQASFKSWID